uniref:Uncharacterized protein n=1 Tax=Cacopsylla melanoneura TaxID=428564 RepID=A0A8D8VVF4_9HEMI
MLCIEHVKVHLDWLYESVCFEFRNDYKSDVLTQGEELRVELLVVDDVYCLNVLHSATARTVAPLGDVIVVDLARHFASTWNTNNSPTGGCYLARHFASTWNTNNSPTGGCYLARHFASTWNTNNSPTGGCYRCRSCPTLR